MQDLLILSDGTFWRFAVCPFGCAEPGDRADPGDGRMCPVREIFRCVGEDVLKALSYAGESVPKVTALWRQVPSGEECNGG